MAEYDTVADVAAKIAADGNGTLGTDLFRGVVRAERSSAPVIPRIAIFVNAPTSGPAPFGVGGDHLRYRSPTIQIRVRHAVQATGRTLAQAIYNDLSAGTMDNYLNVSMNESDPIDLGQNENGAYEWSINVTCLYDQTVEPVVVTWFNPALLIMMMDDD
jgi:hypothetical protein